MQRWKKKKGERRVGEFRKKLKIPRYEISPCAEQKIKLKIGKIFGEEKILEECCVKIYEINFYFYEHYEEKKKELIKMVVTTYYLELTIIFLNVI